MKKLLAVLITLCAALPLLAQSKTRYLISMKRPAAVSNLRLVRDAAEFTAHDVRAFHNIDVIAADLTDAEAAALKKSGEVRYISAVVERHLSAVNTSPVARHVKESSSYAKIQAVPYGIGLVHARDVWPFTKGGDKSVNVAIVDTGIDYTHPDLKDRYQGGFNAFTKSDDPKDDHGHGTHVAGIIGATDNSFGVVGVAPEVKIWSAKVLQANGSGTDESVMAGIDWVVDQKNKLGGNWIINLSLGSETATDAERELFARVIDAGILVVAAAGNTGKEGLEYPGGYDRVVAVSAIDSDSKLADFSTFGTGIVFAAPGVDVISTFKPTVMAEIFSGNNAVDSALALSGTGTGDVTADTVYCGFGKPEEFPADTKGKIALITRGGTPPLQFREKTRNAIAAGAIGVVIVPPAGNDAGRFQWTLLVENDDAKTAWPVVVSTSITQGADLVATAGKAPLTISYGSDNYALMSGTSMATPHVVGVAALVWSLAPTATAEQIRLAMKLSAFDLGDKGHDISYGYGRVDALAAAKYVSPGLFNLPPTPDLVPTRRRPSSPHH